VDKSNKGVVKVVKKYLSVLCTTFLLAAFVLVPSAGAAGNDGQVCTSVGQVVQINGKSYTCLGVLKEGAVPATPNPTASPTTTAKPVPPKPIPAANSACTKVGETRTAPNIIFKCAIVGRKLVWQSLSVEAQKLSPDKLYKTPPPLKTQSPALTVLSSAKSSKVGVPISLQTQGGAGKGIVSFIPSGNGCYMIGSNLFATNAGFCGVIAKKDGDETYNPFYSTYTQYNFEGQDSGALVISNTNLSNPVGTAVTLTTSGGNGNPVIKFGTSNKDCNIEGNILTTTKRASCYVVANQNQSGQYKFTSSAAVGFNFASTQAALQISNPNSTQEYGKSLTLGIVGGSGSGEVTLKVTGQGCLLDGSNLTANAKTSCVVIAKKAADDTYFETYSNVGVFVFVDPPLLSQAPLIVSISAKTVNVGQTVNVNATGGSGTGAITYKVTGTGCKLTGNSLTSTTAVSCVVSAKKAKDTKYSEAISNFVVTTFLAIPVPVDNSKLTFAITNSQTESVVKQRIRLTTIGGAPGIVSYSVTSGNCSVADSYLTSNVAATCSVLAILKPSNSALKPVISAPVSFTFSEPTAPLLITNPTLLGRVGQTINLSTSGGNGNSITFSVLGGSANSCSITGSTLKATSATSCVVTALQDSSGGTNKVISSPVTFTFTLTPTKTAQNPLILNVALADRNSVAFRPIPLSVSGGSGTGLARYAVTGNGCSIQDNAVVANRVATCSVVASKDGDEQYNQAFASFGLFKFDYATQPAFTINNSVTSVIETATVTVVTQGGAGTGAISLREMNGNPKCVMTPGQLSISATGATTCQIVAVKSADTGYAEATSQPVVFTFRKP
jgi:hypothetical protein